jgi:cold shock CspA family protein
MIQIGTVKFFGRHGYGFLTDDAGRELFFHASDVTDRHDLDDLRTGMRVEFVVGQGRDGRIAAKQVTPV